MNRQLQSLPTPAEESDSRAHIAPERVKVGDVLPARLGRADMMRLFGVHKSRFHQLLKRGRFDRFEIRPTIGRRAWSGRLVMAYFNAEESSSRFVSKRSA